MSCHYLQSQPDGCVAAAMCMIQQWRGQQPTEQTFLALTPRHDPMLVPRHLAHIQRKYLAFGSERELEVALLSDFIAAASMISDAYGPWLHRSYPALRSPHGPFTGTMGLHMVVLIGRVRDAYDLLDPFFAGTSQPLRIDDDAFAKCFGGHAFIATP